MKAYTLFGFLLCCTAVIGHPLTDNNEEDTVIRAMKLGLHPYQQMYMYDDDKELVEINVQEDDDETEEETAKDLGNRIFFYLHTKNTIGSPKQLILGDAALVKDSDFDPSRPTKFITHGWMNSKKSAACTKILDAYLLHGDYNVIVIDWSKISFRPYLWTTRRVRMAGEYVAKMIDFLEENGMDTMKVTLVGHSLGAHIVGLAARFANGKVNYAIGLDPALPGFSSAGPGSRIASGDAENVEIIHTNGGLLGFKDPIGDIDFYPNGGSSQVGCLLDISGVCSHARSYQYFAESINTSVGFHAKYCRSFLQMKLGLCSKSIMSPMGGYKLRLRHSGLFYLETNKRKPFAKGA